jgi:ABC-2 type transport system ATP-binding protein
MTALQITDVKKRYQSLQALGGVSLAIEEGEFFGLLGPNGAGKTTLISIIAGLNRADAGSVKIHGHDVVSDYRAARMKLGVVPQELVFDPFFTVRETLRMQSGYFGLTNNDDWIDEVMENLDLTNKADTNMRALSGGMKRRVLVAQALVHKPPVIVLDEPTAGVDVELRQTLWQFISRLNREGHTIVLTTHYLEEAEALCKRIAMLKLGKVVALDRTDALIRRISGSQLVLRLKRGSLPDGLRRWSPIPKSCWPAMRQQVHLRVNDYAEVEPILATLRASGAEIDDLQLQQADLEDVFIQIMGDENDRFPHPVLQGNPALLEGRLPDRRRAHAHRHAVPADLRPCAEGPRAGLSGRELHRLPGAGPGDDERAAERLCQQLVLADPVQDHRQPGVRAADAAVALGDVRRLRDGGRCAACGGAGVFVVTAGSATCLRAPLWIWCSRCWARHPGHLGLIAGIWAEKFDQLAAFQNFLIMPLTFLAGVFYSIHSLPPFWQAVSHFNPFFYMIDGFRYGFFGQSDVALTSLGIVAVFFVALSTLAVRMLKSGYKLRAFALSRAPPSPHSREEPQHATHS